jgi:signal transduction histidine kinase/ActR/RegA family two-component response regulator
MKPSAEAARQLADSIIDTVRTPMLILDKKLRIVSANRSFYQFFYATASDTENRFLNDQGNRKWNLPGLREMLENILFQTQEIRDFELMYEFPLLGPRSLLMNAREITVCGDGSEEILLSFEDVTDRINVETFRRAKEEAEQATETKNEFLASMSHEIRTPMTIILSALEHVLETELNKDQRKFLEMAMDSSSSLLGIIDDILDLSRIEAGKLKFSEAPFLLSNLLESVIEIFAPKARLKGLKLSCDISPETPSIVIGDQNRLRQVLVNLLGNALKFTEQGEIGLKVEPEGKSGAGEPQLIAFSIRDTGIGIPPNRQGDLFQSFSQINLPEDENGGSGLGLAICKKIVEQSGGDIGMESREGEGSVFFFKMPFGQPPPLGGAGSLSVKPPGEKPGKPEQALRILLLEDEADIRELITILLESRGWEVVTGTSGEEGLAAWERERFDLILMDLRMPVMDGFEATRRIREKEEGGSQHVPIIALTAHAMKNEPEKCLRAGMDAFLTKPFKCEEFLSQIERCLSGELG